jgi:hypothetical protein
MRLEPLPPLEFVVGNGSWTRGGGSGAAGVAGSGAAGSGATAGAGMGAIAGSGSEPNGSWKVGNADEPELVERGGAVSVTVDRAAG